MATATFKLHIFYLISYHLVAHLLLNGSQIISNGAQTLQRNWCLQGTSHSKQVIRFGFLHR